MITQKFTEKNVPLSSLQVVVVLKKAVYTHLDFFIQYFCIIIE